MIELYHNKEISDMPEVPTKNETAGSLTNEEIDNEVLVTALKTSRAVRNDVLLRELSPKPALISNLLQYTPAHLAIKLMEETMKNTEELFKFAKWSRIYDKTEAREAGEDAVCYFGLSDKDDPDKAGTDDYCFLKKSKNISLFRFGIGNSEEWLKYSDHLPLWIELGVKSPTERREGDSYVESLVV